MITKNKIKIVALLMVLLLCSLAFTSAASAKTTKIDEKMPKELKKWIKENQKTDEEKLLRKKKTDEWMKEHTLNVTSTTTYTYINGELVVEEVFSGKELEEKIHADKATTKLKIKKPSKELRTISSTDGTYFINEGDEITMTSTTATVVMTYEHDPFPWWDEYDYPQHTWYLKTVNTSGNWYVRADPINMIFENTYKSTVQQRLVANKWKDVLIFEWPEFVSDPQGSYSGNPEWMLGHGHATTVTRDEGGYHMRLFALANGDIVGDAHRDSASPHQVIGLEIAEDLVASFFDDDTSNWWVLDDHEDLDNQEGTVGTEPFCDGEATVVWRVGTRS